MRESVYKKEDTKKKILEEALKLFSERGYDAEPGNYNALFWHDVFLIVCFNLCRIRLQRTYLFMRQMQIPLDFTQKLFPLQSAINRSVVDEALGNISP